MKYQNGKVISVGAAQLHSFQGTRGPKGPKPYGETHYVKKLKEEVERREQEGKTFGL